MARRYNPPDISGMITLKVDNISFRTTSGELRDLFEKFGEIGDVYIPRDNRTGDPRGFAFVRFMDKLDAEEALREMDHTELDGRILRVQFAMQRRPDNPREYYMREYRERRMNRSRSPPRYYDRGYRRRSRSPPRRYRSRSYSRDREDSRPRSKSSERRR